MDLASHEPLVSIIIPVYNGSNYLREAIDSALAQTYANIEVIVVNDGSNDDGATEKIALSYGDAITYLKKENGGVSSALNAGIRAMHGAYFSWLSHDDKYLPDKIQSQMMTLSRYNDDSLLALCGAKLIDEYSCDLPHLKHPSYDEERLLSWQEALKDVIESGSYCGCALLIPKSALEKAGLFDERLRFSQDFLMWMELFLDGCQLLKTRGTYVCNRVHSKQLTQTGKAVFYHDSHIIGEMLLPKLAEKSDKQWNFLKAFALNNAKYNNRDVAEQYIAAGKGRGLLSTADVAQVRAVEAYGRIRPAIRRLYYKLFRHVKTQ